VYVLAFLQGDQLKVTQLESAAMTNQGAEGEMLTLQAATAVRYGKVTAARELTRRASNFALHNDAKEAAARYWAMEALFEMEVGDLAQARTDLEVATKLAMNRDVRQIAPLVMAGIGNTAAAAKLSMELAEAYPADTEIQGYCLPAIAATISLQRDDPVHAVEILRTTNTLELASSEMLTAYVRGRAFLKLHDGKRAAAEHEKFTIHWGLVRNSPYGALARLGLARAYTIQGDTAKARKAYQSFLTLWKDADTDTPVLKRARMEFARIR
jgi:eukaryotic-like serine/threonine-protein kinase